MFVAAFVVVWLRVLTLKLQIPHHSGPNLIWVTWEANRFFMLVKVYMAPWCTDGTSYFKVQEIRIFCLIYKNFEIKEVEL